MRRRLLPLAAWCALLVMLAACGATAPQRRTDTRVEPASSGDGYDFRKEGRIPPPAGGAARPEADVEEMPASDGHLDVTDAEAPPPAPATPVAPAVAIVDGFRIQIFATADRDVAENARDVAAQRLGVPAYVDLEGGVYKVRVGDYARREEADAALPTVRGAYYPDAWVVPARVHATQR